MTDDEMFMKLGLDERDAQDRLHASTSLRRMAAAIQQVRTDMTMQLVRSAGLPVVMSDPLLQELQRFFDAIPGHVVDLIAQRQKMRFLGFGPLGAGSEVQIEASDPPAEMGSFGKDT